MATIPELVRRRDWEPELREMRESQRQSAAAEYVRVTIAATEARERRAASLAQATVERKRLLLNGRVDVGLAGLVGVWLVLHWLF